MLSNMLSNLPPDETSASLLEALWRAEELAGALDTALKQTNELRARLGLAEETVAELTELGDAAQAAIDRLRVALAEKTDEAERALADRRAVATELFVGMRESLAETVGREREDRRAMAAGLYREHVEAGADRRALAAALYELAQRAEGDIPTQGRRGWWAETGRRLFRRFRAG